MSEDLIKARAYEIWERDGRVAGRELDHWLEAQAELTATALADAGRGGKRVAAPSAAAKPKTKRSRRKTARSDHAGPADAAETSTAEAPAKRPAARSSRGRTRKAGNPPQLTA